MIIRQRVEAAPHVYDGPPFHPGRWICEGCGEDCTTPSLQWPDMGPAPCRCCHEYVTQLKEPM